MLRRPIAAIWLSGLLAVGSLACGPGDGGRTVVEIDRVDASSPALRAELQSAVGTALTDSLVFATGPGRLGGALRLAAWVSASDLGGPPQRGTGVVPSALFLHLELEVPAELRKHFDVAAITARARLAELEPGPESLMAAARSALEVLELPGLDHSLQVEGNPLAGGSATQPCPVCGGTEHPAGTCTTPAYGAGFPASSSAATTPEPTRPLAPSTRTSGASIPLMGFLLPPPG